MTSPTSIGLGLSKCVGCESSKSAVKCSLYRFMGALLGRAVGWGTASVAQAGRPPFLFSPAHPQLPCLAGAPSDLNPSAAPVSLHVVSSSGACVARRLVGGVFFSSLSFVSFISHALQSGCRAARGQSSVPGDLLRGAL